MNGFFNYDVPGKTKIKISVPMMYQEFHPCSLPFINKVCKGYCCEGAAGISVFIAPGDEQARIEALGAKVVDSLIQPDARGLCPFKTSDGLCQINDKKPFQCSISPFCLSKSDTLIVRNRFRILLCYKCGNSAPAYKAHRWSLTNVVGIENIDDVVARIEEAHRKGTRTITVSIDTEKYKSMATGRDTRPPKPVPCAARKANPPNRENLKHLDSIDG